MATSLGKDGALTREEIKSLAERTFKAADKDRDGKLSDEEYAHVRAIRMAGQQDGAAPCRYC
jgi:Ca2+-binding EF-hand superfamily protein